MYVYNGRELLPPAFYICTDACVCIIGHWAIRSSRRTDRYTFLKKIPLPHYKVAL